jgi:small subunit ribosomal protein S17
MSEQKDIQKKSKPLLGYVTSDRMDKSRVATIERFVKHSRYAKYMRRRTKIMFHDENNETKIGDSVLIMPSRPYSAKKKFNLLRVVERAGEV